MELGKLESTEVAKDTENKSGYNLPLIFEHFPYKCVIPENVQIKALA
jgi:hypothetical protein